MARRPSPAATFQTCKPPRGGSTRWPRPVYETMGDEVLCPHCGAQFVLQYSNSVEYQHEQEIKQRAHDEKIAKTWFYWAIGATCVVAAMIIGLIVYALDK